MADRSFNENQIRRIDLVATAEEWFVHVTDGERRETRSFPREDSAEAFAESQRIRLSINRVERI